MPQPSWDEHYASGQLPWDTGEPEPLLVELIDAGRVKPCRTLEVGAGTGTNARWLAERGFEVLAVDIAPLAVEQARAKLQGTGLHCRFEVLDFLAQEPPGGPFGFVFDRGCFHVFDEAEERDRFAARVATALSPAGYWFSLIGSTEGPPRDTGPPRRSAREVALAIEPHLEVVELRGVEFRGPPAPAKAWSLLARRRDIPAQPSTRR